MISVRDHADCTRFLGRSFCSHWVCAQQVGRTFASGHIGTAFLISGNYMHEGSSLRRRTPGRRGRTGPNVDFRSHYARHAEFRGSAPISVIFLLLLLGAILAPMGTATASAQQASSPLQFIPVTPCRVADTRGPGGPFGGPELPAKSSREFDIPQSACGIPSTALAYSLNVTVVPGASLNYLTIWPSGQTQPYVSTLNSYDGRIKANAAITPAGTNGGVSVYVSDATNVILDIDGYFVPAGTTSGLAFYPLTPCRVADTRGPGGPLGGPFISAKTSRDFPVLSSSCSIPSTAQAYSLNVT